MRAYTTLITGSMYAGKTEALIDAYEGFVRQGLHVVAFKHAADTRYDKSTGAGPHYIVSHNKRKIEAYSISNPYQILEHLRVLRRKKIKPCAVFIDEFQFFSDDLIPALLDVRNRLVNRGIEVYFVGLNKDFRKEDFVATVRLIRSIRTRGAVITLTGICRKCNAPGTLSQRYIDGSPAHYDSPINLPEGGPGCTYFCVCEDCHILPREPVARQETLSYKDRGTVC